MTTAEEASPAASLEGGVAAFVASVLAETERGQGGRPATVAERRRIAEAVRAPWRRGGPVMESIRELRAGAKGREVKLRLYRPGGGGGALIYLHGGGWTLFSVDTHDRVMREYAARSGLTVVGVDYSLSPEARFPQALEEVVGVIAWLSREGEGLGLDPARLAVGGDSAGANLALAACLMLRGAAPAPRLRAMLLNYGAFDVAVTAAAARRFGGPSFMLTPEEMAGFWRNYLRGPKDETNPLACPLRADLAGLPPAFVAVAACDILAEQNLELAARLSAADVETRCVVYPGASHSFLEAVSVSSLSERALAEASAWLRAVCG